MRKLHTSALLFTALSMPLLIGIDGDQPQLKAKHDHESTTKGEGMRMDMMGGQEKMMGMCMKMMDMHQKMATQMQPSMDSELDSLLAEMNSDRREEG